MKEKMGKNRNKIKIKIKDEDEDRAQEKTPRVALGLGSGCELAKRPSLATDTDSADPTTDRVPERSRAETSPVQLPERNVIPVSSPALPPVRTPADPRTGARPDPRTSHIGTHARAWEVALGVD
jgi:hypothetical protein